MNMTAQKTTRIWTIPTPGRPSGGTWRELQSIARNEHGDILLTLDGGDVWQFSPKDIGEKTPLMDEVKLVGFAIFAPPGTYAYMQLKKPEQQITPPGNNAWDQLKLPERQIDGHLRILAAAVGNTKPTKKTRNKINYKLPRPTKREIKIAEVKILDLIKSEKGITPYAIVMRMPEWWEAHGDLKKYRCPSDGTFKNWAAQVLANGYISKTKRISIV